MKIIDVKATPLAIPNKQVYIYSQGRSLGINSILIEISTDEGIVGIGEASGDHNCDAALAIVRAGATLLIGASPFDVERFYRRFYGDQKWDDAPRFANQAAAGLEMALWDIIGKAAGRPVHQLLGGKLRDRISFFGFLQGAEPDEFADHARRLREDGFNILYMKIGRGLEHDIACVRAVRNAVGDGVRLRVDANQAWTVGEALQTIRALDPFGIDFVEQPVSCTDFDGMARLRAAVGVPLAIDQACFTDVDVLNVIRRQLADVITIGFHETGGLLPMKKVAAIAAAGGLPICRHGVSGETGITTLAGLQLFATIPNQTDGHQVMHQLLDGDLIVDGVLRFEQGTIAVPDRPGLGIELDRDRVERYARLYEKQGGFYNV